MTIPHGSRNATHTYPTIHNATHTSLQHIRPYVTLASNVPVNNGTTTLQGTATDSITPVYLTVASGDSGQQGNINNVVLNSGRKHPLMQSSSTTSMMSMNSILNHNNWEIPRDHVRSIDKRNRQKRIEGTVTGSNVKGDPPVTRDLFIYCVDKNIADEDMRVWISNQKVKIIDLECLNHINMVGVFHLLFILTYICVFCLL